VQRLVELTDPKAPAAAVKKALGKKFLQKLTLAVRAKALDAPIALAEDIEALAGCALTLEFLLRQKRTAATHAFTVPALKEKAAGKLKKPLQDAVNRHLAQNTIPPTVGWVSIGGKKLLFLLSDLHVSARQPALAEAASAQTERQPPATLPPTTNHQPPTADFAPAFDSAFARLDRQGGGHNFVSLVALRQALPVPREQFDRELRALRQAGRYTLSAAEGRHGISPEEREAGITEEGSLLLFVSRSQR
jgi:hypothetical protein